MPATETGLHVDKFLTNISIAFVMKEDDFVSDKVFPVVPVQKKSDSFVFFERGTFYRSGEIGVRPLGGTANIADWDSTTGSYIAEERALATKIDDRQRANTDDPISQDRAAARKLQTAMAVDNDKRWVDSYFTAGQWTTDLDGSGADFTQFDDGSSVPIDLVDAQSEEVRKRTTFAPNTIVAGARTWRALKNHPDIKELIKFGATMEQPAIVTRELLAQVFGVDRFLVAWGVENSAAEGQTDALDFIAPDDGMLLVYAAPQPAIEEPSGGYTFAWTGLLDGAANLLGSVIQRGRDELSHSDHFEIRSATDLNLVAPDLGVFFENTVAGSF